MNKLELKISATLENECVIRNAIACFASIANPTLDEIIDIKTILSEAVSNAIIHGYEHDKNQDVYVKAILDDHRLEIIVQDYGKGIEDIQKATENHFTTAPEQEKSGIGFTIMKTLSDHFEISSKKNVGTKLKIVKILSVAGVKA